SPLLSPRRPAATTPLSRRAAPAAGKWRRSTAFGSTGPGAWLLSSPLSRQSSRATVDPHKDETRTTIWLSAYLEVGPLLRLRCQHGLVSKAQFEKKIASISSLTCSSV